MGLFTDDSPSTGCCRRVVSFHRIPTLRNPLLPIRKMNPVHQLPQSPAVSSPKGSLSRLPSNLGKGLRLGTEEKTKQKNEERHKGRQRQREKRAHGTGGHRAPLPSRSHRGRRKPKAGSQQHLSLGWLLLACCPAGLQRVTVGNPGSLKHLPSSQTEEKRVGTELVEDKDRTADQPAPTSCHPFP